MKLQITKKQRSEFYTLSQLRQSLTQLLGKEAIAEFKNNWGLDLRCRTAWEMIAIISW